MVPAAGATRCSSMEIHEECDTKQSRSPARNGDCRSTIEIIYTIEWDTKWEIYFIHIYIYIYILYACMYGWMDGCMYVCMYGCMHACMYV